MTIEIDISVRAATLVLSTNAGNFRAGAGSEVVWSTKDPRRQFTLEFFNLTVGGDDSPFTNGVTMATVSRDRPFRAVLKERCSEDDVGAFKYSVTTGGLSLDPIIVVGGDKK